MKRANPFFEFAGGIFILGVLTLVLIIIISLIVPRNTIAKQRNTPLDNSAYPPPFETNSAPSPEISDTETPLEFLSTITPIPITPFPTLTLKPEPTSTPIPILDPAEDSTGSIFFVAKEGKEAKSKFHKVEMNAVGEKVKPPAKVSDEEARIDGFIIPSPNGNFLAITGPWGALSIYNTDKNKFEKTALTLGAEGIFFNWHPDNQHILWGGGSLVLADPYSGEQTNLVVPGYGGIIGAAASPDGQYVVYSYSSDTVNETGLWIINTNGQHPRLLSKGVSPTNIAWSPDGKRIAFYGRGWQVIDADGTNQHEIAPGIAIPQCYFLPPLWSPDSRRLAVVTSESGTSFCHGWTDENFVGTNIVLIDIDGGKIEPLPSEDGMGNIDPAWSPDGSYLAFVSNRGGSSEIWVVNLDGSNLRQLTKNDHQVRFPNWRKTKQ
jgi:WD40 repeat protein